MKAKSIYKYILFTVSILMLIVSLLSVFRNSSIRYLKLLDFPRIQFAVIIILLLVLVQFINKSKIKVFLTLGLILSVLIHLRFIINYTPLVRTEVQTADREKADGKTVSLIISNVKMTNRTSKLLIESVKLKNPDLLLLMETDQWWENELASLKKLYRYSHKEINNKTYGMILFSKFPLDNFKVNYLNNDYVPSFVADVEVSNKKTFRLYCVHPVPPTYFENLPDNKGDVEKSLMKIGQFVKDDRKASIVAGDFNDVVWGQANHLTGTKGILNDVRVGRGFYNSFDANSIFMRWPLDHILLTDEFKLKKFQVLKEVESDHFPIYAEFMF